MAADAEKDALRTDVLQLNASLEKTLVRERSALASQGKSLDITSWFLGLPTDQKYANEPPYLPLPGMPTLLSMTASITAADWGWTAAGMAVAYGIGHQHAPRIGMPGLRGHRFGAVLAAPILILGWTSGARRSFLRHLGYLPNGRPSRFPGYTDDRVPHFVKHRVSDKRRDSSPAPSVPTTHI